MARSGRSARLRVAKDEARKLGSLGGVVQLQWNKCAGAEWCLLDEVDLARVDAYGVFVVWRPGDMAARPSCSTSAAAHCAKRSTTCRRDPVIGSSTGLRITWAKVDPRDVDGVAAYLYQQLRPLWGEVPRPAPATASEPAVDGVTDARPV